MNTNDEVLVRTIERLLSPYDQTVKQVVDDILLASLLRSSDELPARMVKTNRRKRVDTYARELSMPSFCRYSINSEVFPGESEVGDMVIYLLTNERQMSYEDVLRAIEIHGMRAVNIFELLRYVQSNRSRLEAAMNIVALGSPTEARSSSGETCVPLVHRATSYGGEWMLREISDGWIPGYFFAVTPL